MGSFIHNILRTIIATLDYYIYDLIQWITQIIFDLSQIRVHASIIDGIRNRVYAIFGIVLLFKLTIVFLKFIVVPEDMDSDTSGAEFIIKRTIMTIVALMIIPFAFNMMYRAQEVFLPIIPKIIFQDQSNVKEIKDSVRDKANQVSVMMLRAFFSPYKDPKNNYVSLDGSKEIDSLDDFWQNVNKKGGVKTGINTYGYSYDYSWFFATLVGLLFIIVIFKIALKVASRVFKLAILEIIAPIAVFSLIKTDKSGKSATFSAWLNTLKTTFLELFFTLTMVYFIIYFTGILNNGQLFTEWQSTIQNYDPSRLKYLKVMLVLGLLFFAQEIPTFMKQALNLNIDGASLGKSIGGATGAISGGIGGFAGGLVSGRGIRTSLSGAISGARKGFSQKAPSLGAGYNAGADTGYKIRTGKDRKKVLDRFQERLETAAKRGNLDKDQNINAYTIIKGKQNLDTIKVELDKSNKNISALELQKEIMKHQNASSEDLVNMEIKINKARQENSKLQISYDKAKEKLDKAKELYGEVEVNHKIVYKNGKITYVDAPEQSATIIQKIRAKGSGRSVEEVLEDDSEQRVNRGGFDPKFGFDDGFYNQHQKENDNNNNNNNK